VTIGRGTPVLSVIHAAHADRARQQGDNGLSLAPPRGPGLAWGAGVHACLGRHLAAVLLQEAVRAVVTGPVTSELAPGPLKWQRGTLPVPAALPAQAGLPAKDHQRRRNPV
jgi:cytochrome P450